MAVNTRLSSLFDGVSNIKKIVMNSKFVKDCLNFDGVGY